MCKKIDEQFPTVWEKISENRSGGDFFDLHCSISNRIWVVRRASSSRIQTRVTLKLDPLNPKSICVERLQTVRPSFKAFRSSHVSSATASIQKFSFYLSRRTWNAFTSRDVPGMLWRSPWCPRSSVCPISASLPLSDSSSTQPVSQSSYLHPAYDKSYEQVKLVLIDDINGSKSCSDKTIYRVHCVQKKNTHSHFLSYLHEWCVDLNKNYNEYT